MKHSILTKGLVFLLLLSLLALPVFAYDIADSYSVYTIVQNPLYYTMRLLKSGESFQALRGDLVGFVRPSEFDSFKYADIPSSSWGKFYYSGSFDYGSLTVTCPISVSDSEAWLWIAVPATTEYGDVIDLYCSQARIGTGASWTPPSDVFRYNGYLVTRVHLSSGSGTLRLSFSSLSGSVLPSSGSLNFSFLMSDIVFVGESVTDIVPVWGGEDNVDLTGNILDLYEDADFGGFFDNVVASITDLSSGMGFCKSVLALALSFPVLSIVLPFVMCLALVGLLLGLGRAALTNTAHSVRRERNRAESVAAYRQARLETRSRNRSRR